MLTTKHNKINIKRKLIKKLSVVKYWLEKYHDKQDTLNKLYYIILIYINNDKEIIDKDLTNLSKYAKKKELQMLTMSKTDIYINLFNFFNKNNIEIFNSILLYDKNINYFDKIKEKNNLYFERFDLEIRFLPNFLQYDYIIILLWIFFCKAINKKSNNPNNFLHDIYLFQNEENTIIKINYLIIILDKMMNYIQFFDYDNSKINDKK